MSVSFDDAFAADELPRLYAEFGVDGTVKRGSEDAVPVRVIVDYDVVATGDLGQLLSQFDQASFMLSQWRPEKGDLLTWTNRFGTQTKKVGKTVSDDGLEAKVVIHG